MHNLRDTSEQWDHQECNYFLTSDNDQWHMRYESKLCIFNKIYNEMAYGKEGNASRHKLEKHLGLVWERIECEGNGW